MSSPDSTAAGQIAVVGMASRTPGAENPAEFWRNLRDGVESVRRFTDAELRAAGESPELLADPDYVPARPVIANADQFDAGFFGLSPQDAAVMDPQHRLFLEVGWEALENAGHDSARFDGSIGVFATCGMNTYMMYHLVTNRRIMNTVGEWLVRHTGNDMNFLATRLSYQLGLKGPSMNFQTACSSSLVAIHVASQSLLNGECDMALAGGSVIALPQDRGYLYKKGEILSPDGHCRAFDARAEGTLFGSGAGMVVLRRLEDALSDGDQILALIKGSAVNNDGAMKVGYLAPSVEGQSRAVTEALAVSGIDPETISYVEAHGTGTLVGDPIEITALTQAFRRYTEKRGFCAIGSLKSNIGHLGEAAGIASFIKTVLSLQHKQIPPSLHYETPNPRIDFEDSPFFVTATLRDWTTNGVARRAGVTSLGAGGTNCHVIVEEAPAALSSGPAIRPQQLLVLSAKTTTAVERAAVHLASHLESNADLNLADVAYTLQAGRQVMAHRRAVAAATIEDAARTLRSGGADVASGAGGAREVVFLFPGGGAQYPEMAAGIYRTEPVFRRALDQSLSVLQSRYNVHLRPLLFPTRDKRDTAERLLERSSNSILSIFAVEYALAQLWMSWGVGPSTMIGHSVGEYAAACVAGVFSLEDALKIVHARGEIFDRLPAGAMLSVALPEAELSAMLGHRLSVAAVNGPALTVVSGPVTAIDRFERELTRKNVEARRLPITVAAHSSMLDPFLDEFKRCVECVHLSPPTIPFVSNLSGGWIGDEAAQPSYWVKHLRQPVRFADGLARLLERPAQVLLEVGPGRTLSSLARQQLHAPVAIVSSIRHRDEDVPDDQFLLRAAGRLWANGIGLDWRAFHGDSVRQRVPLPTYPFERKSYWVPLGQPIVETAALEPVDEPVIKREPDVANWFFRPHWTSTPTPRSAAARFGDLLVFDNDSGLGRAIADEVCRPLDGSTDGTESSVLEFPNPADTLGARLVPANRRQPGPGEVEILVHAAALNFADALKVSGVMPDAPFGMEAAGVVVRCGPGVTTLMEGDEVVAIGPDSFRTHVTRDARLVAKKPPLVSWEATAALPAAFMTAIHSFESVAGLAPGERVLIHAASGGVGLAALQVATARGAEIFATAGTAEKRARLKALGIDHIFDSRTPEFADEIRARTDGRGVDVVLNSLTGDLRHRTLEIVAPGGRFVELGKRELLTAAQLREMSLADSVSYLPVDLTTIMRDDPDEYGRLLREVVRRVTNGELQPLPSTRFSAREAGTAFDLMIRAQHIGKIVLDFEQRRPRIWFVETGHSFHQVDNRFTVRPTQGADYHALFAAIGPAISDVRQILHLWNVDAPGHTRPLDSQLELSFFAPLRLIQELGRLELSQRIDVTMVSTGVHRVAGELALSPVKATLLGPSRVLQRELPNMVCRHVDLEAATTEWQRGRVVKQVADEIRAPIREQTIAFRGSDRWVQSFTRVTLDQISQARPSDLAYLITGGLGGLGLATAERLAAHGARKIALVGRTGLPDRDEWNDVLARDPDGMGLKVRAVRACEAHGAEVLVLAADVASRADIQRAIWRTRAQFGRITGVYHTAGTLADGLMLLKSDESALDVLKPKLHGTLALHEALSDEPPEYLVLFSSISAVLGLEGQVDYVAANAFLDAFAHEQASAETRVVSANWGAWREVGLAVKASNIRHSAQHLRWQPGPSTLLERQRPGLSGSQIFETSFHPDRHWIVGEHRTRNRETVLPGTAYLAMADAALAAVEPGAAVEISQVFFNTPFAVPATDARDP